MKPTLHCCRAIVAMSLIVSAPAMGQRSTSAISLDVNIPAYRLDIVRDGHVVQSFPVTVGTRGYPTPVGNFAISAIEWNPWWIPPPSGWAAESTRTPPGPHNPMGRVKMRFTGAYFIHATSAVKSLGRAASHGCVRLAERDAVALARTLHAAGAPADLLGTDTVPRSSVTTRIPLAPAIPVSVRYALVEIRHDSVFVFPDVYRRERVPIASRVMAALAVVLDTSDVRSDVIAARIPRTLARPVAIALADLRR